MKICLYKKWSIERLQCQYEQKQALLQYRLLNGCCWKEVRLLRTQVSQLSEALFRKLKSGTILLLLLAGRWMAEWPATDSLNGYTIGGA